MDGSRSRFVHSGCTSIAFLVYGPNILVSVVELKSG